MDQHGGSSLASAFAGDAIWPPSAYQWDAQKLQVFCKPSIQPGSAGADTPAAPGASAPAAASSADNGNGTWAGSDSHSDDDGPTAAPMPRNPVLEVGVSPNLWREPQRGSIMTTTPGQAKATKLPKGPMICQVEGCGKDLAHEKGYYQRYRVCEQHLKMLSLMVDGNPSRFCQQCGRFHDLSDFDGTKRSCRQRLQQHNQRRRKRVPGHADASDSESPRGKKAGALARAPSSDGPAALNDQAASGPEYGASRHDKGNLGPPDVSAWAFNSAANPLNASCTLAAAVGSLVGNANSSAGGVQGASYQLAMQLASCAAAASDGGSMYGSYHDDSLHLNSASRLGGGGSDGGGVGPSSLGLAGADDGYCGLPNTSYHGPGSCGSLGSLVMGLRQSHQQQQQQQGPSRRDPIDIRSLQRYQQRQDLEAGGPVQMGDFPTFGGLGHLDSVLIESIRQARGLSGTGTVGTRLGGTTLGAGGSSIAYGSGGLGLGLGGGGGGGGGGSHLSPGPAASVNYGGGSSNLGYSTGLDLSLNGRPGGGAGYGLSDGPSRHLTGSPPPSYADGLGGSSGLGSKRSDGLLGYQAGGSSGMYGGSGHVGGGGGGGGGSLSSGVAAFDLCGLPPSANLVGSLSSHPPAMSTFDLARMIVSAGNNQMQYRSEDILVRVSMKVANCRPEELPHNMYEKLQILLASSDASVMQGFLRPGCTHLVLSVLQPRQAVAAARAQQHATHTVQLASGAGALPSPAVTATAALAMAALGEGLMGRPDAVLVQRGDDAPLLFRGGELDAHANASLLQGRGLVPTIAYAGPIAAVCGNGTVIHAHGQNLDAPGVKFLLRFQGGYLPLHTEIVPSTAQASANGASCPSVRLTMLGELPSSGGLAMLECSRDEVLSNWVPLLLLHPEMSCPEAVVREMVTLQAEVLCSRMEVSSLHDLVVDVGRMLDSAAEHAARHQLQQARPIASSTSAGASSSNTLQHCSTSHAVLSSVGSALAPRLMAFCQSYNLMAVAAMVSELLLAMTAAGHAKALPAPLVGGTEQASAHQATTASVSMAGCVTHGDANSAAGAGAGGGAGAAAHATTLSMSALRPLVLRMAAAAFLAVFLLACCLTTALGPVGDAFPARLVLEGVLPTASTHGGGSMPLLVWQPTPVAARSADLLVIQNKPAAQGGGDTAFDGPHSCWAHGPIAPGHSRPTKRGVAAPPWGSTHPLPSLVTLLAALVVATVPVRCGPLKLQWSVIPSSDHSCKQHKGGVGKGSWGD